MDKTNCTIVYELDLRHENITLSVNLKIEDLPHVQLAS